MAVIRPFRGVCYNPARVTDLSQVLSQPHDKINEALQAQYYNLNPYNIVRIIKGSEDDPGVNGSRNGSNIYSRGRSYYDQWLEDGILIREGQPAFYINQQIFDMNGYTHERLGLIAAVELAEFDERVVLPHELIHPGPMIDRLNLIEELEVSAEPIFMIYPDEDNHIDDILLEAVKDRVPDREAVEIQENTVTQRLWKITDPALVATIQEEMAKMPNLVIADGHHRYNTALAYRKKMQERHRDAPPDAGFNFIAAMLVSVHDPGLEILPTHREIRNFTDTTPAEILERAEPYFDITPADTLDEVLTSVNADKSGYTFGFYCNSNIGFQTMKLRDESLAIELNDVEHSDEWKQLTVSVLHGILLEKIAEVPYSGIESREMIRYRRDPHKPVENVDAGIANFAFFIKPTDIDDVMATSARGEIMPQKSTDFYPKAVAGLTMMPIDGNEKP